MSAVVQLEVFETVEPLTLLILPKVKGERGLPTQGLTTTSSSLEMHTDSEEGFAALRHRCRSHIGTRRSPEFLDRICPNYDLEERDVASSEEVDAFRRADPRGKAKKRGCQDPEQHF